jgi:hypothetical protein
MACVAELVNGEFIGVEHRGIAMVPTYLMNHEAGSRYEVDRVRLMLGVLARSKVCPDLQLLGDQIQLWHLQSCNSLANYKLTSHNRLWHLTVSSDLLRIACQQHVVSSLQRNSRLPGNVSFCVTNSHYGCFLRR